MGKNSERLWSPAAQAGAVALCIVAANSASAGGKYTTIDPSGSIATFAYGINDPGVVTGYYEDDGLTYHGFLRGADGTITSFDVPGAMDTYARCINVNGAITGYSQGTSYHGFLRAVDGTITSFDIPNSTNTVPISLNDKGAVTGSYLDSVNVWHGFVFGAHGSIKSFDPCGIDRHLPLRYQ